MFCLKSPEEDADKARDGSRPENFSIWRQEGVLPSPPMHEDKMHTAGHTKRSDYNHQVSYVCIVTLNLFSLFKMNISLWSTAQNNEVT